MSTPILPGKPRERVQARLADGRIFEAPPGTALAEVLRTANGAGPAVVAAVLNGKLCELTAPLNNDSAVIPLTLGDADGMRIYRRSLILLLVVAAHEVIPEAEIMVEHSATTAGAYYCEVRGHLPFTQEELKRIEDRMREIVAADEPFVKSSVPLGEAVGIFRARGEEDKVRLLAHRQKNTLVLYTLRGYRDYLQGYMVPSTGYLPTFALHVNPPGFMLQFPHQTNPTVLAPVVPYPKLFEVFEEAGNWLDRLGIRSVGALNDAIVAGRLPEISLVVEALHESRLSKIASAIADDRDRIKVVLIAGPSSSGKTTFAKRLAVQLLAHGLHPFPLSLDNYFVDRDQTPRDETGQLDYETIGALDLDLFNEQLRALIAEQPTEIPRYNFLTGKREPGPAVKLGPEHVVLVEGIHGLNPALVPGIPAHRLYRIYVSALTQLNLDRHNRVSTTDTRIVRRIVRDAATRGYSATDTLRRWKSVERGEKKHIFPFQENSDSIFNSSLVHELAVLRPLAEPLLLQVRPDTPEFHEANRLLSFLQWFRPAPADHVPDNSILREFIGGSILEKFELWHDPSAPAS